MTNTRSLLAALLVGLVLLGFSAALAEFVSGPAHGHRINTAELPAEARAILAESPGVPISAEQWHRLDTVMSSHGGWPGGGQLFAASVRHSWYWFIALPVLAVLLLRRRAALSSVVVGLLAGPSLFAVAYAFMRTPLAALL